jgi:hypothetical protein
MTTKHQKAKTFGSPELAGLGGRTCLAKHGRDFYRRISLMRWKEYARVREPSVPSADRKPETSSKPKASKKTKNA